LIVSAIAGRQPEFGCENDLVTSASKRFAYDFFCFTMGVGVRRVDKIDSTIKCGMHNADALALISVTI
jgi:hypothetical protein